MKATLGNPLFATSSRPAWNMAKVSALAVSLILAACSDTQDTVTVDEAPVVDDQNSDQNIIDNADVQASARYRLTFTAVWSEETHPTNFPGNPHFSGLVGAVHNEQVRFWEPAQIASEGIQQMAETGGKSTLLTEVQAAIDAGSALSTISGGGVGTSPGATSVEIEITRDYPQITVTSMLAPSPDWFVGVHNFSLMNSGEFIDNTTVELMLYDSGSDNGLRYTSGNEASAPLSPISSVSNEPVDGPFIDGEPSVGSFIIERITTE